MRERLFRLLLPVVLLFGCGPGSADLKNMEGTVVFVPLEGGFYGVLADDGNSYLPSNLPLRFAKDGQRIVFDAKFVNRPGTAQWGRPIRFVFVDERLRTGGHAVAGDGTVVFLDLEGGFFALFADDGERYEPRNLRVELAADGQRVRFTGHTREDLASALMWGTILELFSAQAGPAEPASRVVREDGTLAEDGILGDDGVFYRVTNEPESLPEPGTRVAFVAVRRPELATGEDPVVTVLDLKLP